VNRRRTANPRTANPRTANRPRPANRRRRALAVGAAAAGIAAALVAGYAAAGATGLIDVASVATLGVLIVARGTVREEKPRTVRDEKERRRDPGRRPALRAADFPAYATIASDLEWARMSRRHYEHTLRPRLARLAAILGRSSSMDLGEPGNQATFDSDGPGIDLATLERIVTKLEEP
jgi:hypothetical protein